MQFGSSVVSRLTYCSIELNFSLVVIFVLISVDFAVQQGDMSTAFEDELHSAREQDNATLARLEQCLANIGALSK